MCNSALVRPDFDVLYYDRNSCLDQPYVMRRKNLENIIKEDEFAKLIPMSIVENEVNISDVMENSINAGCEGLMLRRRARARCAALMGARRRRGYWRWCVTFAVPYARRRCAIPT